MTIVDPIVNIVDISNVVIFDSNLDIKDEEYPDVSAPTSLPTSPPNPPSEHRRCSRVETPPRGSLTDRRSYGFASNSSGDLQSPSEFVKCMCDSDHEFIIDWIDIDPDKSQQIVYCKFCYLEGDLQKIDLEKLQSNTIIDDDAKNNSTYRNEKS